MNTFVYDKNKSTIDLDEAISAMYPEILKEALIREKYGYQQEFFIPTAVRIRKNITKPLSAKNPKVNSQPLSYAKGRGILFSYGSLKSIKLSQALKACSTKGKQAYKIPKDNPKGNLSSHSDAP